MGPFNDILGNSCIKCKFNFSPSLFLIYSLQYLIIAADDGKINLGLLVTGKHHHLNSVIPENSWKVWRYLCLNGNWESGFFSRQQEVFYCRKIVWLFLALGTGEVEQNIFRAVENAATQAGFFFFTLVLEGFSRIKNRISRKWLFFIIFYLLNRWSVDCVDIHIFF